MPFMVMMKRRAPKAHSPFGDSAHGNNFMMMRNPVDSLEQLADMVPISALAMPPYPPPPMMGGPPPGYLNLAMQQQMMS